MENIYAIPEGLRVYAIGDVHGCADLLERMHETISMDLIENAPEKVEIVYLGDYIDRGAESKKVIDILIARRDRGDGISKTFLKGNHEMGMFEFMEDPIRDGWLNWGGVETLASYGVVFEGGVILPAEKEKAAQELVRAMPAAHRRFFEDLVLSYDVGGYFFAHAGVDPFKPLKQQREEDLTFIREPFLSWHKDLAYKPLPKRIVHGHSVTDEPCSLPHRVGVDTGAYESGVLSCAVLEGADVRFLQV